MASTYSPSLKLELIGAGDQSGTWGSTTNNNLGILLEQAITGVQPITMSNADYVLTSFNGTADEARNQVLVISGTNSAIRQVVAPLVEKTYIISNQTTGGFAITIGGTTGVAVTIPNGITAQVFCNGTNFYSSQTGSAGNFYVNGTLLVGGAQTNTTSLSVGTTLAVTGATTLAAATGTTITASTQFVGPGTGLTGTGASFTAGNATLAASATQLLGANWTVLESAGYLYFRYGGVNKMRLDSTGNLVCTGNVTAYGTI